MVIFLTFSFTSSHLHPLQVENCDSNSRLVVDEDDTGQFSPERVKHTIKKESFKSLEVELHTCMLQVFRCTTFVCCLIRFAKHQHVFQKRKMDLQTCVRCFDIQISLISMLIDMCFKTPTCVLRNLKWSCAHALGFSIPYI